MHPFNQIALRESQRVQEEDKAQQRQTNHSGERESKAATVESTHLSRLGAAPDRLQASRLMRFGRTSRPMETRGA